MFTLTAPVKLNHPRVLQETALVRVMLLGVPQIPIEIPIEMVNTSVNFSTQSHAIGAGASYHGNRNQPTSTRRIIPVRMHDTISGWIFEMYALLNNGSDVSLCDAELVRELDLQCEQRDFILTTQGKKDSAKSGLEPKLTTNSLDGISAFEVPRV